MPKVETRRGARNHLTLTKKLEVIEFYKNVKCSIRKLAKHFKIGKTSAGEIIKNQDKLMELWHSNSATHLHPDGLGFKIDKQVYEWYEQTSSENIPVSGRLIQNKALEIAKEMGYFDFKASSGWLGKFQKRHNICLSSNALLKNNAEKLKEWKDKLSSLMSEYSPDDILCARETGLFFQALPEETNRLKEESCLCGKFPTERFTVLFCTSMTGIKESPVVITNISKIKNSKKKNLSKSYCNLKTNDTSWMTCDIMTQWLKDMDKRMVDLNRKVILFLNNTSTHHDPQLKNIKIMYFPVNLSVDSNPMNHGILQIFKIQYRLLILEHLMIVKESSENGNAELEPIDVYKALGWVGAAWNIVTKSIIQRSFIAAGYECTPDHTLNDNEPSLNDVAELLYACDSEISATDYVNIDNCLVTEGEDPEFIEVLVDGDQIFDALSDDDDDDDAVVKEECLDMKEELLDIKEEPVDMETYGEVLQSLKEFEQFYLSQKDSKGLSLVSELIKHNQQVIGVDSCNDISKNHL